MPLSLRSAIVSLSALAAVAALGPAPAQAQSQVLDFATGSGGTSTGNNSFGWQFTLSTTVTVTDLGFFDNGNNGLVNSHQVGLWNSAGSLLASTTLASGLSGTSVVASASGLGAYRYNGVSPVVLTPGTYSVGASYITGDSDAVIINASNPAMLAGFSYGGGQPEQAAGAVACLLARYAKVTHACLPVNGMGR